MWWRGVQHRYKIYNLNAYIVHKRGDENLSLSLSLFLSYHRRHQVCWLPSLPSSSSKSKENMDFLAMARFGD